MTELVEQERTSYVGRLEIRWDPRILEPRPWTVEQSRWAARLLTELPAGPVLELCSGAGHIGLVTVCGSRRRLVCVDVDPVATTYAEQNAARNGLAGSVEVRTGTVEAAAADAERYALVIADPPWVPSAETGRFPEDPLRAIDGGAAGIDLALACVRTAEAVLVPGGLLLLQLGSEAQVDAVVAASPGLAELERRVCSGGVLVLLGRA
jgi:methylase of polypeptide subunit release factors